MKRQTFQMKDNSLLTPRLLLSIRPYIIFVSITLIIADHCVWYDIVIFTIIIRGA